MSNIRFSLLVLTCMFNSSVFADAKVMTKERTYEIPGLAGTFSEQVYNLLIRDFNIAEFNRVILHGPPGVGKTELVKKLATYHDVPLIIVSPADIMSKFSGGSVEKLKDLFEDAVKAGTPKENDQIKRDRRTILFIDELEASKNDPQMRGEYEQVKNQLIMLLDKYKGDKHIFFIGATNRYDLLDCVVKDRFRGNVIEFSYPNLDNRRACIQQFCSKLLLLDSNQPRISQEIMEYIAQHSQDISIRSLEMFLNSLERETRDIGKVISLDHVKRNLEFLKKDIAAEKGKEKVHENRQEITDQIQQLQLKALETAEKKSKQNEEERKKSNQREIIKYVSSGLGAGGYVGSVLGKKAEEATRQAIPVTASLGNISGSSSANTFGATSVPVVGGTAVISAGTAIAINSGTITVGSLTSAIIGGSLTIGSSTTVGATTVATVSGTVTTSTGVTTVVQGTATIGKGSVVKGIFLKGCSLMAAHPYVVIGVCAVAGGVTIYYYLNGTTN